MRDFLFVGLDVDTFQGYEQLLPDQQLHIGLSTLDTRDLDDAFSNPGSTDRNQLITSYQLTAGNSQYCRRASNRFPFGTSQPTTIEELKAKVESLIPLGRDIVLVSHGTNSDFKIIQQLNIDLPSRALFVVDTNKAAQFPLRLCYRYGLAKLLGVLKIPFANLHAAGNDARFCLQALLMLVVRDAEQQPSSFPEALVQLFRDVAQAPRPPTAGEIQAPIHEANREAKLQKRLRKKAKRAARRQQRMIQRSQQGNVATDTNKVETSEDTD
ncbi:qde-2-interacting protein [Colletotrichum musicola]|uniref:Qde-2-interacting protein n=1 Tax=Colletotrichum musicola TaxID=2175873 RepID=A0A8H6IMU5_9PEZI|nr:qde-2-interacting protein [Colletotrichum musicola]